MQKALFLAALAIPAAGSAQSSAVATTHGRGHGHSSVSMTVGMNQTTRINQFRLKPAKIVEDSRCPRYVSCVWRGRLVVAFDVAGAKPITLENGKPVSFGGGTLTLLGATPVSGRGEPVPAYRYRFQLEYER